MLAVYRHRLTLADDFHHCYLLQPAFGKRDNIHPADHQVIQQADIHQGKRLCTAL
jgi:hypothetical protein